MPKRKPSSRRVAGPPSGATAPSSSRAGIFSQSRDFWLGALLFAAVFIVYLPALNGGFIWDDDAHVTKPALRSLAGLARIWFEVGASQQYYPLLHSAFWLEHRMWGDAALGYHLVNLIFHASAAYLLAGLLRRLAIPGAWLAAFLFALHPVQVESVAWITEQKNTLSLIFYLLAAIAYVRFDQKRERTFYLLALGLFLCGLLTKTVTATLPAALLVGFWWQRGKLGWKRDVLPLLPWFALGATTGLFTAWVERTIIGAEGAAFDLSAVQRGLLAGRVICFYLGKLFWPVDLMFFYPRWTVDPAKIWQYGFPLAVLGLLAAGWWWRGRSRAPLAVLLLFIGSLFPVLGFLNVFPFIFSFVADHFQYLASVGIFTGIAAGLTCFFASASANVQKIHPVLVLVLVTTLGVLTVRQARLYRGAETLYQTMFERNPDGWMLLIMQSSLLHDKGQHDEAISLLERVVEIRPDSYEAHHNLGVYLQEENRLEAAILHDERAVQINPLRPESHINLGIALKKAGRKEEAIARLQQALRLEPNLPLTLHHLGDALGSVGRGEEAIKHYEHALRIDPNYNVVRYNLGTTLAQLGRIPEAITQFEAVLQRDPTFALAHYNMALSLSAAGRTEEALPHIQEAVRLDPSLAQPRSSQ